MLLNAEPPRGGLAAQDTHCRARYFPARIRCRVEQLFAPDALR